MPGEAASSGTSPPRHHSCWVKACASSSLPPPAPLTLRLETHILVRAYPAHTRVCTCTPLGCGSGGPAASILEPHLDESQSRKLERAKISMLEEKPGSQAGQPGVWARPACLGPPPAQHLSGGALSASLSLVCPPGPQRSSGREANGCLDHRVTVLSWMQVLFPHKNLAQ